ncbi:MAG: uroporphyrinogen decarboxylase [Prevotella sp.]|nr:uroporphyrinogen decarboxylase [Prevotella sp.]
MTSEFLNTLMGHPGKRPPIWLMRQAGRVLPRYQLLRQQHSFTEIMNTPELAAEVTLMPVEDLGVDAAILFSDILTIPVAMGMEIEWTESGPRFLHPLHGLECPVDRLDIRPERLKYVYEVIDRVVDQSHVPLIGFCGAPLTTMCYMLQGISTKQTFPAAKKFFYENREETERLIAAVTEISIDYARQQIEHGIDAFQLFESHAGLLPSEIYAELFLPAVVRIADAVRSMGIPFIFFPKGLGSGLRLITPDVCDFVSIDWQTSLLEARQMVHSDVGIQGNLDPHLLFAPQDEIAKRMESYRQFFHNHPHWIVNLGHGVLANTPLENIKYLVNWVKYTQW